MSEYANQVQAHKARRQRFAEAAARFEERLKAPATPAPTPAAPDIDEDSFSRWLRRQERLNPLPKEPWFSVVSDKDIHLRIETIQRVVCKHFGIRREDLLAERRTADVILPRHIAIYLSKQLTPKSLPEIGRRFGGRDHTTILSAVRKIAKRCQVDPELAAKVATLKAELSP